MRGNLNIVVVVVVAGGGLGVRLIYQSTERLEEVKMGGHTHTQRLSLQTQSTVYRRRRGVEASH